VSDTERSEDAPLDDFDVPDFNNPAFRGAWEKGVRSYLMGDSRDANPYDRDQFGSQGVTFARAFWRRWNEGFDAAEERYSDTGTERRGSE